MENFSSFFDLSGKQQSPASSPSQDKPDIETSVQFSTYNDNIIDNNTNINNSSFPTEDYYILSNEIILGAIKQHKLLYDTTTVPYAFIAFYFNEYSRHQSFQDSFTKQFLVLFHNKKNNVANAINIFARANSNVAEIKYIKKASLFSDLKQGYYLDCKDVLTKRVVSYNNKISSDLKGAIECTRAIIDHIASTVKDSNFKLNYLQFLTNNGGDNKTIPTLPEIKFGANNQPTYAKQKQFIAPPKQEQQKRISNISLPKLKTNRIYPTSLTMSRIDSAHFAFKFVESDRMYNLLKKYKFCRVSYTEGFEKKRKALFAENKSDYDLF